MLTVDRNNRDLSKWDLLVATTVVSIGLACSFGDLLFRRRTFVFRDSSHYYYPLWNWITEHWRRGEFPLWNPYENAGTPLAADATASLFYPGKLLFLLPVPFDMAYNSFLVGHFVLAFWLAWRAARSFRLTPSAATFAAMAYTFSGSVLTQHANAPYLIGAAWLPLAVSAGWHALAHRSWIEICWFAVSLSMMILGGDVQTAYHCLVLLPFAWFFARHARSPGIDQAPRWHRNRVALIVGGILLASGLAAIQILPARAVVGKTVRATYDDPRSIYEAGELLIDGDPEVVNKSMSGLFGRPLAGSHHELSYGFSTGPWRWGEFIWPNVSGRMFPVHRRWINIVPAEGRVWSPSLYLGVLPFLLAISVWRVRRGNPIVRWLSTIAFFSLFAALGWYGIGWILHEIYFAFGFNDEPAIGPQVGGLYWLLSSVLPGYAYLRYPAKWMTIFSLAISLLAGYGMQTNLRRFTWRAKGGMLATIVISAAGFGAMSLFRGNWSDVVAQAAADPYFGPLNTDGAWFDCTAGLLQTLVVVTIGWALFHRRRLAIHSVACALLAVTAVDLAIAQNWLTPTAPVVDWHETPAAVQEMGRAAHRRIYRGRSPLMLPPEWQVESSSERLVEGMRWERDTLHAKHHLTHGVGSIDVPNPMRFSAHEKMMRAATNGPTGLGELSVTHRIMPTDGPDSMAGYPHLKVERIENAVPRVFLTLPRVGWDQTYRPAPDLGTVEIVDQSPNKIDLRVAAVADALLVVNDTWCEGWIAEIWSGDRRERVPINQVRGSFRGVAVPPSNCRVVMTYAPQSLWLGSVVSLASWLLVLSALAVSYCPRSLIESPATGQ